MEVSEDALERAELVPGEAPSGWRRGDDVPDLVVGNSGDTSIWVFYNDGEPPIFVDGFESGDTTAWSATVP